MRSRAFLGSLLLFAFLAVMVTWTEAQAGAEPNGSVCSLVTTAPSEGKTSGGSPGGVVESHGDPDDWGHGQELRPDPITKGSNATGIIAPIRGMERWLSFMLDWLLLLS